jgi:CheY-like chemotaxis protein
MQKAIETNAGGEAKPVRASAVQLQRPARVLIAEDDWAMRELLLWAFDADGYEVTAVASGPALLETLASSLLADSGVEPFDLVVSDIRMPGWSGLPAMEELCRSRVLPPVVAITAFGSEEVHERAERAGAIVVLDKPFDVAELTALGDRLLAHRAA